MLIQINTDNNISGSYEAASYFSQTIEDTLRRFSERITRVEVHLSDENSHKQSGGDKRCMIEVRPKGMPPIAVTHQAENLDFAVSGAAEKMKRSLENTFGKLDRR
jgi:ribosome-associated translation inhibitor RaiA